MCQGVSYYLISGFFLIVEFHYEHKELKKNKGCRPCFIVCPASSV